MIKGGYDTELFIEIIKQEGAKLLYEDDSVNGFVFVWYERNSKRIAIIKSDVDISITTAKDYLRDLELSNLIPLIFPEN